MKTRERRAAALELKCDIVSLAEIAIRLSKNKYQHNQIVMLESKIHADLADYEIAWRNSREEVE